MANQLGDALAQLSDLLIGVASEPITYSRGALSVDVQAVIQLQRLEVDDGQGGIRVEFENLDACIRTVDLTFDGVTRIEPRRGDLITRITAYDAQVFEVLPLGGTDSCWRWSDPIRHTMRRVHAKYIDTGQFD